MPSVRSILPDASCQQLVADDPVDHCASFAFRQPIDRHGRRVRPSDPGGSNSGRNVTISSTRRFSTRSTARLNTSKHMALNLIRGAPGKDSFRLKRKIAAWDDDFLASLITA
jgi:hypothetical protein